MAQPGRLRRPGRGLKTEEKSVKTDSTNRLTHRNSDTPADLAGGYDTVTETHRLEHLGCWTHCRRYFHEALQALPKGQRGPDQLTAGLIALIGKL
jgi:hypothetical protein